MEFRKSTGVGPAAPNLRIAAGDQGFEKRVQQLAESVQSRFRYHTIELPDGSELPGLQTTEHLRWRLSHFNLPEDLTGRRVLDIGAWDGWFSFECERRGAQVTAVDCVALDTFLEARDLRRSKVEYLTLDVAELSPARLGHFDIVLFFGVLYHLRHPLLGLEKVVEMTTDLALIESFVIAPENRTIPAVVEFYERGELGGQIDNWCGPSPEGLLALCRSAGFAQAELKDVTNQRASVTCRRRWSEPPGKGPAPHLSSIVNNRTQTSVFHPLKDEYLSCYFRYPESGLTTANVFCEVDGYGTQTLAVNTTGEGAWQVDCLRPPGLCPGRHWVHFFVSQGPRSNAACFEMANELGVISETKKAITFNTSAPELCSAELHPPGDRRTVIGRSGTLIAYFRSTVDELAANDIDLDLSGEIVHPHTVGSLGEGVWQANRSLNEPVVGTQGELAAVRVRLKDGEWSRALQLREMP